MSLPNCPNCQSDLTYMDNNLYVCPMCFHEWSDVEETVVEVKDVHGNVLNDGDSVAVIRDLKIKGAPTLKQNTTIKNIVLRPNEDENVMCKVDGFGTLFLKSEFLKKI